MSRSSKEWFPSKFLKAEDLGSIDDGTPVFFRRLQVGEVTSYELDDHGKTLTVKVFVNSPYDKFVTPNTRFWQASGIDVSLSAAGLSVQTQSVLSMLVGGIAFEAPESDAEIARMSAHLGLGEREFIGKFTKDVDKRGGACA